MDINVVHLPLCMYITKTQNFPYGWRSMQYNQTTTVNSCGFTGLANEKCIVNTI